MTTLGEFVDRFCPHQRSIDDDQLPTAIVVLTKIENPDGSSTLRTTWSEGLGWIERRGMLEVACEREALDTLNDYGDGEDPI